MCDKKPWALIVHGGAATIPDSARASRRAGCEAALDAGRSVLSAGGTAVDAVAAAVRVLESDPQFNAGYGADTNSDGQVECDAAVMDGETLNIGGVAAVKGIRHPVTVAHRMLTEDPVLLVAEGAVRFAAEKGIEISAPETLIAPHTPETEGRASDTVGCVAIDGTGSLAAATSTGGLQGCRPGRVGDSPMPGCGFYASNKLGAVSLSGDGEMIARAVTAMRVAQGMSGGVPSVVAAAALAEVSGLGGEAGVIAINPEGEIGWAHTSPDFAVAFMSEGGAVQSFTRSQAAHVGAESES